MGNQPPSKRPQKKVDLDDAIIQMKIQSKGVMRAAKKAEKQSDKYMKQARQALKKNNEDFAKLHLTSASQKKNEANHYQRTAIKMEFMCDRIKSMKNNQQLVNTFSNMTNLVSQQMAQMDTAKMFEQMQMFNDKMDETMVNNKMMTELMTSDNIVDTNVDGMMDVLKQQLAMQQKNALEEPGQQQVNYNINKNQQQQQKQEYQMQQGGGGQKQGSGLDDPFLDQLKGL